MHEKGSATAMMFEKYMQKNDLSIHIPLEFSSNRAIKLAVEDGIGIGITSHRISEDEIEAGKLSAIPFSDRSMKHKYYLVHHKDKYLSETLQRLIQTADEWSADYTESLSDH